MFDLYPKGLDLLVPGLHHAAQRSTLDLEGGFKKSGSGERGGGHFGVEGK